VPVLPSCLLESAWVEVRALLDERRGGEPPEFAPQLPGALRLTGGKADGGVDCLDRVVRADGVESLRQGQALLRSFPGDGQVVDRGRDPAGGQLAEDGQRGYELLVKFQVDRPEFIRVAPSGPDLVHPRAHLL